MDVHSTAFPIRYNPFLYLFLKIYDECLFILQNLSFYAFINHLLRYLYLFFFITIA